MPSTVPILRGVGVNVRLMLCMMVGAMLAEGAWGGTSNLNEPHQAEATKIAVLKKGADNAPSDAAAKKSLRQAPNARKHKSASINKKPAVAPHSSVVKNHNLPLLVFPFEYVGKLYADGKEVLLLSKGEQIYSVVTGQLLENLYRVEKIGNDSLELTYLPDARKMSIALETITKKYTPSAEPKLADSVLGSHADTVVEIGVVQPEVEPPSPEEAEVLKAMEVSPSLPESEVLQQMLAPAPAP